MSYILSALSSGANTRFALPRWVVAAPAIGTVLFSFYCGGAIFRHHFVDWSFGSGPSMYPTLASERSMQIVSHAHRYGRGVKVGDVVIAYNPMFINSTVGKRVIGMSGDYVVLDKAEAASVGAAPIPGKFRSGEGDRNEPVMVQVPEGHVWLAGDNLPWSRDSRTYGPVPMGLVVGKVIAKNDGAWFRSWTWWGNRDLITPVEDTTAFKTTAA